MSTTAKAPEGAVDARRSFEFATEDGTKTYYLGLPTSEQIRKAEWHYSKMYNKALVEGVSTTAEMMDILTKRGIYGPDYEKKLQELQVDVAIKIAAMQNEQDTDAKAELAREVERLRDDLYRWNQRLTGPLSNSCEQMAEDAKTEYLTSVVVQDESGDLVWESYDAFVAESNQGLALKARFEVMLWLQGLDADFLEKTPERTVLREVEAEKAAAAAEKMAEMAAAKEAPQLEAPQKKASAPKRKKRSSKKKAASAE